MDFHLKQCRKQEESEQQQHSAKITKFFAEQSSLLPFFLHSKPSSIFSPFPTSPNKLQRMCGFFSVAQRQELELQALIFRYMLAGAAVPPELLHLIKKSLFSSNTPFFLQHFPNHPTTLIQGGYWGRAAMDPEPGRCRRTDGKKWRCSRDVVAGGQKYCERHMHRGRNRSRKPVETATTNPTATVSTAGASGGDGRPFLSVESGNYFSLSGQTPSVDLLHLNQRACSDTMSIYKNYYESHKEEDCREDNKKLRHFFDDWPRSDNRGSDDNNVTQPLMNSTSTTSLSISIPGNLSSSSSSDVSLKLSTGGSFDDQHQQANNHDDPNCERVLNWSAGWAATGGPLAEALHSSANNNSWPPNSEATFIST